MAIHSQLSKKRWHQMPLIDQLANVGSEYDRAIKARKKGKIERFERAFERFLELLDWTIADPKLTGYRLREITRLREMSCQSLTEEFDSKLSDLIQRDFLYYGIASRNPIRLS